MINGRVAVLLAMACGLGLGQAPGAAAQQFDVLIRNGRVLDGTGNPWYRADIGINGDRIAAVGDLAGATGKRTIDAQGLYVAPGFIDTHSHAGPGLATAELSHAQPLLAQGITTVIVNPDGGGPADLVRQRSDLLRDGLGVNVGQMVPHGSVRGEVLGMADRAPTPQEMERMRSMVRAGMEAGGFGLSSGPYYAPGSYSKTDELVELARIAGQFGGVYTSHVRDESDYSIGLVAALDEVIQIAREAQLPGIHTHIKALGPRVWGFSGALVQRIDRAREQGVQVYADQYPYEASSTGLNAALLPRWAQAGGLDSLARRIADPAVRTRLRGEMLENLDRRGGADRIQISRYRPDSRIEGKTLQQIADERGVHPIDLAMELVNGKDSPSIVSFNMDDEDITTLMRQPWMITASDGDLVPMGQGVPHPRAYGTFPRKIRRYVLEEGVIDLASAVRSMTSLPATVFGISGRGELRPDAVADLVIFDLAKVRDRATYDQPHQLSEGMVYVMVNGTFALEDGRFTGRKPGIVLSRRGPS